MSALFQTGKIGKLEVKNRFIHSATYEVMSEETGEVTDKLIKKYERLARGEVGLIIPGYMYVHPLGRAYKHQTGIHSDDMIPGLTRLADSVHEEGGKIVFQIVHAGRQTTKAIVGQNPIGPSSNGRDPMNFVKPDTMTEDQIEAVINAFTKAAQRAVEAGADGIQLHGAHGYLINQFLSPFFNLRTDQWGASDENRFRFLKEIFLSVKKTVPEDFPVLIKLNTNDHTPKEGITPELAEKYARWLAELGIDGIEVSSGSAIYAFMNMCRGEVPVAEITAQSPWWLKPLAKMSLKRMVGKYDLEEGYHLAAAKIIKPNIGKTALCLVGGMRNKKTMEAVLDTGYADFISMSRPFIREPLLVKNLKEGKTESVACESCNRCAVAVLADIPVKCYNKGFPKT